MSKYEPLGKYLQSQGKDEVPMTFAQIERVTGTKLPRSARYRAWWSNNPTNSVMTKVWLKAGFRSERVDISSHKLVFRRARMSSGVRGAEPPHEPDRGKAGRHPLFGALKGLLRIAPNTDITQPADPEWGARR